jgi:hypothetical protein
MPSAPVLTRRQLNRALLGRQMLLARTPAPVAATLEQLVGLQAQTPLAPYVALWSRLDGFDPLDLAGLIERHEAVRIGLLRTTIHLVTARDAVLLRPLVDDVLARAWKSSAFNRALAGIDVQEVLQASRDLLEEHPRTAAELGVLLQERWPDRDRSSLAYASRFLLPLVQVPPRGLWRQTGLARHTTLEAWTGGEPTAQPDLAALVVRYLAAFGPASVADLRTWSWLTGLRPVVEGLRPQLRTFRDEAGHELFDVPDGLLPDPETPAPPRFLPDYDNVLLSHADRSRVVTAAANQRVTWDWGALLVDGFVAGTWKLAHEHGSARLVAKTFETLAVGDAADVTDEAARLLAFLEPDATSTDVQIVTDPDQMKGRVR